MGLFARLVTTGAVVIASTGAAGLASALESCAQDIHSFCRGLEHGHGAVQRCLEDHLGDLSSACRAHLQGGIERARTPRPADREGQAGKGRAKQPDQ